MAIAKILAVIDGGAGSEAALETALRLGRKFNALVDLLHVRIDPEEAVPILGEGVSGIMIEQMIESLRAGVETRAAAARDLYERYCVDGGLPLAGPEAAPAPGCFRVGFHEVVGRETEEVARRGRLADLVIVASSAAEEEGVATQALEAALFETGRPVLMAAPEIPETLGETIAVAWDDTPEATRAAAAALPFLAEARKIVLLSAGGSEDGPKPSHLAGYLAHHGIAAKTWAFAPGNAPLGEELLAQAAKAEADMIVMGAYGHSRLREMVLGGVTRSVTAKARIPVLLVH